MLTTQRYGRCLNNTLKQCKRTKSALKRLFGTKDSEKNLFEELCRLCEGCWAEFDHEDATTKIAGFTLAMNIRMELVNRMYIEYVYKQIGSSLKELNKLNKKIKKQIKTTLGPLTDAPYQSRVAEMELATETSFHAWREQQCLNTDRIQLILSSYSHFQIERLRIHQMCVGYVAEAVEWKFSPTSQSTEFADFARDAKKSVDQAIEKLLLQTEYGGAFGESGASPGRAYSPDDYLKNVLKPNSFRTAIPEQYY